jgi:hypothetical protein
MTDSPSHDYRSLMIAAAILAFAGWLGLLVLLTTTVPTVGPRWLFFFLGAMATTGTSLPFIWLLHRRFRAANPSPSAVLLRQGLEMGLFAELCAWLQINRSLTLALTILLAIGIVVFEWFLNLVERTTWRPKR